MTLGWGLRGEKGVLRVYFLENNYILCPLIPLYHNI